MTIFSPLLTIPDLPQVWEGGLEGNAEPPPPGVHEILKFVIITDNNSILYFCENSYKDKYDTH